MQVRCFDHVVLGSSSYQSTSDLQFGFSFFWNEYTFTWFSDVGETKTKTPPPKDKP